MPSSEARQLSGIHRADIDTLTLPSLRDGSEGKADAVPLFLAVAREGMAIAFEAALFLSSFRRKPESIHPPRLRQPWIPASPE
jgi:hypothetical protein